MADEKPDSVVKVSKSLDEQVAELRATVETVTKELAETKNGAGSLQKAFAELQLHVPMRSAKASFVRECLDQAAEDLGLRDPGVK